MQNLDDWLDKAFIGFNRENFVSEILNPRFGGNITDCAAAVDINAVYFRDVIKNSKREMGLLSLTKIWRYCVKNNLKAERYIFIAKEDER